MLFIPTKLQIDHELGSAIITANAAAPLPLFLALGQSRRGEKRTSPASGPSPAAGRRADAARAAKVPKSSGRRAGAAATLAAHAPVE